jgi:hypothetical protein
VSGMGLHQYMQLQAMTWTGLHHWMQHTDASL